MSVPDLIGNAPGQITGRNSKAAYSAISRRYIATLLCTVKAANIRCFPSHCLPRHLLRRFGEELPSHLFLYFVFHTVPAYLPEEERIQQKNGVNTTRPKSGPKTDERVQQGQVREEAGESNLKLTTPLVWSGYLCFPYQSIYCMVS